MITLHLVNEIKLEMNGICRLCLEDRELIKKSHLFPNFMYKGIGDEKNRMYILSSSDPDKKIFVQSGAYEENIFCAECDNERLGRIERYANNYFYNKPFRNNNDEFEQIVSEEGVNAIKCKNIDYLRFKLFLESLLWRASISNHTFFDNFKLTDEQEEVLRSSIYINNPLDEFEFPCNMLTYQDHEEVETDLVFINTSNKGRVSFYLNNFLFIFYLDDALFDEESKIITLNKNNEMGVLKLPTGAWNFLRTAVFEGIAFIAQQNKAT